MLLKTLYLILDTKNSEAKNVKPITYIAPMKTSTYLFAGIIIGLVALAMTNPTEENYLTRLGNDYGNMHHGTKVSNDMLKHMGKSERTSYLFFSTYHYAFGNATADYYGVGMSIFFKSSSYEPLQKQEEKTISI